MKNKSFYKRLGFALAGIRCAFQTESSFRTQIFTGGCAVALLVVVRAQPVWWAIFSFCIGGVLGAELLNTALELVIDRLHPEPHPIIAQAKDCAAGAVLVFSLASLAVAAALLWETFKINV
jgi:undecaprenol kinase